MSAVRTIFWTAERKRRKLYSMGYDVIDVDSSREGRRGGAALFGFVVTRRSFETRLFQRVDSHTFTVSPVTRDKKSTGLRFSERWEKSKRMQRERNGNAIPSETIFFRSMARKRTNPWFASLNFVLMWLYIKEVHRLYSFAVDMQFDSFKSMRAWWSNVFLNTILFNRREYFRDKF